MTDSTSVFVVEKAGSTELSVQAQTTTRSFTGSSGQQTTVEITGGPPGPMGPPGPAGSDAGVTAVAAASFSAGTPLAVDRATGRFIAADAAVKSRAFVVGLLSQAVEASFVGQAVCDHLTLADWSTITGTARLSPGIPYFLAAGGGLTAVPPASPACIALVGKALDTTTLLIDPQPPIEL